MFARDRVLRHILSYVPVYAFFKFVSGWIRTPFLTFLTWWSEVTHLFSSWFQRGACKIHNIRWKGSPSSGHGSQSLESN